jgi:glucosamine--fructose-6-phosphate aminotransferase (isomerizing)
VVSQSGASAETTRRLQQTQPEVPIIAVTNFPTSPPAARAGAILWTKASSENSVSCRTYVITLVALSLLRARLIGNDPPKALDDLRGLPEAVSVHFSSLESQIIP